MNTHIEILYISYEIRTLQRASFPTKGRKPEQVAYDWWRQIKREKNADELVRVLANQEDITEKVRELEKAPLED